MQQSRQQRTGSETRTRSDLNRERWIQLSLRFKPNADPALCGREYDDLYRNPKVLYVIIEDDGTIRLKTLNLLHRGAAGVYYFGRGELRIVNSEKDRSSLNVKCTESGRHDGQLAFPYHTGSETGMCFGTERSAYIGRGLEEHDFFGVLSIALDSLTHINEGDGNKLMDYRRVLRNGSIQDPSPNKVQYVLGVNAPY